MKRILCVFALALSAIPAVSQQSPEKPAGPARAEVLVAPRRQDEIAELITILKKFHPKTSLRVSSCLPVR